MIDIPGQFREDPVFARFIKDFSQGHIPASVCGMCESARPFFISAALKTLKKRGIVVLPEEKTANAFAGIFKLFFEKVYVYPARDFVFENVTAYSRDWEHERLSVLSKAISGDYDVIITVPDALMQYTIPAGVIKENSFVLERGGIADINDICRRLVGMGYTCAEIVEGAGQYAVRGGILDVFTPNYDYPVRIDFFGDEIDLIGSFDTVSQRRIDNLRSVEIIPCTELLMSDAAETAVIRELKSLISDFEGQEKRLSSLRSELEAIDRGDKCAFSDKYFSLLYPVSETLLDADREAVRFIIETKRVKERAEGFAFANDGIVQSLAEAGMCRMKHCRPYCSAERFFAMLGKSTVSVDQFAVSGLDIGAESTYKFNTRTSAQLTEKNDLFISEIEDYAAADNKILLVCSSERAASVMIEMLGDEGIASFPYAGTLYEHRVAVCSVEGDVIRAGFELPDCGFVLLSDYTAARRREELRVRRRSVHGAPKTEKIAGYADLKIGDLVVHVNHGIGRYEGIENLVSQGVSRDFIKIVYADNGKLYVPCDQLDMVSKYIGGAEGAKLSKMGGDEWRRAKAKAKAAASDIAKDLIRLYAERRSSRGFAFPPDDELQDEFESGFEYVETDGQSVASDEIKRDMENPDPMDRLLCGDVGFGKTEVSLRAMFKCVFAGKQAAMLVPTTILAFQHYRTILERFRGYPVRIAILSRFVSAKESAEIIEGIKKGTVDIVVGTHRLLQKNIEFKSLGLLVVDEEQRFGVVHKEKLKEIAAGVDVLTLTATPIPRTLNMALSGIRDMSVLEEAPTDRVPVQTFVLEQDDGVIFEAVRRELRRGGQVFYLHNSIDSIYTKAKQIKNAFPDNTVAVAHGRMDKEDLSDVWADMVDGKTDILVCTTIIESGVNVPNANTLIIEDADRLGLAQLHQIRGRVGRSSRKAYAYLTYRPDSVLNEIAEKRLEAIREFTEFGSGFKIAMRDLELRGAGNLLGSEQSGHLEAIGYDLYIKILEDAINAEKGIEPKAERNCVIDIRTDAYIPEKYIPSQTMRIDAYKKIAAVCDENDRDDLTDELNDRFGDIPKGVNNLINISLLRNTAMDAGFTLIKQDEKVLSFFNPALDIEKCAAIASESPFKGAVMISMGGRPHIAYRMREGEKNLDVAYALVKRYSCPAEK